jgi:hypothetical protein
VGFTPTPVTKTCRWDPAEEDATRKACFRDTSTLVPLWGAAIYFGATGDSAGDELELLDGDFRALVVVGFAREEQDDDLVEPAEFGGGGDWKA